MVKLVKGRSNTIDIRVRSFINYTGFTANLLMANGLQKFIPSLSAQNPTISFSAEEIQQFNGRGMEGLLTILSQYAEEYSKQRIWFAPIDKESEAINFQKIYINLVQDLSNKESNSLEPRVAALEVKVADIDERIDDVIEEKIEVIMPTVIRPIVKQEVQISVQEDVEPMVDRKIADAIGGVNTVLDELNGEVF